MTELDGAHYLTAGNAYTKTESDNRYVQNIQRGAPVWPGKVDEYGPNEAPAGCFLTQTRHDPTTADSLIFVYRPLQISKKLLSTMQRQRLKIRP